ncbi:MAG: hypothetical protein CMQ83_04545 [Gammaproteobacteria bacterium]|nr:hypothetical protein [Gammaproteobacteria bacterium]
MDLCVVVHIKSSYDSWKAEFDNDLSGRSSWLDEERTTVGKVDDNTAIVQLFNVDMEKMKSVLNDSESAAKIMEEHVLKREFYSMAEMKP